MRDMKKNKPFPTDFQKVVDYLKTINIEVVVSSATCFFPSLDRIYIDYRWNFEKNGLFALLHETGHALQPNDKTGVDRYRNVDQDDNPKEFNMLRFINEVNAWDNGLSLAKELNIDINMKNWEKLRDECLLTYYV